VLSIVGQYCQYIDFGRVAVYVTVYNYVYLIILYLISYSDVTVLRCSMLSVATV
jgi:hypothetical protein